MAEMKISIEDTIQEEKVFTLEELNKYDGQNGNPSYIAIRGVVYDISNVALLRNGKHHGVTAGKDVTNLFPHDINIMKRVKVVGKLKEEKHVG